MNFSMFRGNTQKLDVIISSGEVHQSLVDALLFFTAAKTDGTVVFQKSIGSGIEIVDAAEGSALITIAPEDTAELTSKKTQLKYDIELETESGEIYTVVAGTITVEADITVR